MTEEVLWMKKGKVVAISISEEKGQKKHNIPEGELIENLGLKGDAHAEPGLRQVSLLAQESIEKMQKMGLQVKAGDFAENITTSGLDLSRLKLKQRLSIGKESIIEITQIGKICHDRCEIYYRAGDCIMPKEGVFAKVIKGGKIRPGDEIISME